MSRIYTATVSVEISVGVESIELLAEVRFVYHPEQPDHWNKSIGTWEPGGGGEIEDVELISLKDDCGSLHAVPDWLKITIEENADRDTLREVAEDAADGHDPDDAYDRARDDREYDRMYGSEC